MSTDRRVDKEDVVYIYVYRHTHTHTHTRAVEYYSAIKNEMMPFAATWMHVDIIILREVSHKGKEKYMILLICEI